MARSRPIALEWCADRPAAWAAVGVASLLLAVGTVTLGYGFAALVFLLGTVVSLGRALQAGGPTGTDAPA